MLKERDIIAGRYRLDAPIGEGAMGAVWRAEDQTLKRQVAIKFLFVKGSRDPQGMVDQFLREARIAASVQHRNVIHTVDFGTVDDFQPFMVMELLNGESLGDRMAREPRLSGEQLVHIISLTLRGLSAVHDAGIVHRDLKPHNVFLQRDADAVYPKILDFGISRSLNGGQDRPSAIATSEGLIVGTPDYMSPEQARGEPNIDRRADIYSMGAILFEGLSGRLPYIADTIGDLIVQIVTSEPPRLTDVAPHVPKPLADLVAQAMSKNREHRFADARAMRRALVAAAEAAFSRGGRLAASVPPPPVQAAQGLLAPPQRAGRHQASAWGDFEGMESRMESRMESPRIRDNNPPPQQPGASPAPPKQQRLVAPALDLVQSPQQVAAAARTGVRKESDARADESEGRIARRSAKGRTRSATQAEREGDLLDPLYAEASSDVPELDFERIRGAQARPARERKHTGGARARAVSVQHGPPAQVPVLAWLVPIAILAWGAYMFYGGAEVDAGSLRAQPIEAAGSESAAISDGTAPIREPARARRASPGTALPHLRDVVF